MSVLLYELRREDYTQSVHDAIDVRHTSKNPMITLSPAFPRC